MIFNDKFERKAVEDEVSGIALLDNDILVPKFKGEVRDKIIFEEDGEYEVMPNLVIQAKAGDIYELPVSHNLVVDSCSKLIAALMKGESGYAGIKYWEVGSGQSSWSDSNPPSPSSSDTGLNNPLFRKQIQPSDIIFIDANSNPAPAGTVTNRLQVTVTFGANEANGYLREFGLFGGNATSTLGSGIMVNRKTHGVIYKTSGMSLQRTLRLTF